MTQQLIYFDANKKAYNYEIPNFIATTTLAKWKYYSQPENMNKWDIINGQFVDIQDTPEYQQHLLEEAKAKKVQEIKQKNYEFYSEEGHTITIDLPCVLQKGEETKQVASFKLLTLTSAGSLTTVIMGYTMMANSMDIPDLLNDDEGYTVVGLNNVVSGTKFINLIFLKLSEKVGFITQYQRYLESLVEAAESIFELDEIVIDFENPVIPEPPVEEPEESGEEEQEQPSEPVEEEPEEGEEEEGEQPSEPVEEQEENTKE